MMSRDEEYDDIYIARKHVAICFQLLYMTRYFVTFYNIVKICIKTQHNIKKKMENV